MEVLSVPPNEAHVMADALHIISDNEDIDSVGNKFESVMTDNDSIV